MLHPIPRQAPETAAFIEVDELLLDGSTRRIFTGWTFAESPGLHAVEHPTFDVWLTSCKIPAPRRPWQTAVFAKALKRLLKPPMERRAADFLGAELAQMVGDELRVEQAKAAISEPGHEIDKRYLARIGLVRKHAFPEERTAERNPVKAAHELTVEPSLTV